MAAISLDSVSKTYSGGISAVSDVSLHVEDSELIVLVGPSGCGKSTLLRMVAGLETITGGQIRIGERIVNDVEPADRDIAMVFQNYALYPHMSVRQNMAYGLKNRGTPRAEIEQRVTQAAKMLQLLDYLDRKPRQLSGGQRQRVAMGRAVVREPACFLFDEPLSNLDAKLRVEMRGELRLLQRRLATTSIYVTHDQLEAMTLADRLVVLNGGRIEQIGTPLEVYRRPASTFVASFIGSPAMNLMRAERVGSEAKIGSATIPLTGGRGEDGSVILGMRAEDIVPAGEGKEDVKLKIAYVEELGAGRLVHADLEGQRLTVAVSSDCPLNEEFGVRIDPDSVHLFDAESGRRIDAN